MIRNPCIKNGFAARRVAGGKVATLWAWVLLGLFGGLLVACGGDPGAEASRDARADAAAREGILLRGNGAEPESLDPHLATSVSAGKVLINLFEGLVRLHPQTLEVEPAMAERWEVSDDGRVWTFFLREAVWSDGEPVSAQDFVFAFRRLLNPELAASYAFMLHPLKNAAAVNRGEGPVDSLGVSAPDARTLRLELERPAPQFLAMLAHWTAFPLPEHVVSAHGDAANRSTGWTRVENLVVNGPFQVEAWIPEEVLRLRKNYRYWQSGTVELAGADYIPFGDPATEERAFRGGEIHLTYSLPGQRLAYYREHRPEALRTDTYLESVGYVANVRKPPLDDVRVRQALSLALDRGRLTRAILRGVGEPAESYVPPGTGAYRPHRGVEEDLERAQALLADAGYPGGEGLRELELIVFSGEETERVAAAVQQLWKERLGVRISINHMERALYFSRRRERDFDFCFLGWVGDYVDPVTFLGLWHSEAGNNLAGWGNPEYDAWLKEASGAEDRYETLAKAEALLLREMPVIPLYFGSTQYLLDPQVVGWHANVLDQHPLRAVRFEKKEPGSRSGFEERRKEEHHRNSRANGY